MANSRRTIDCDLCSAASTPDAVQIDYCAEDRQLIIFGLDDTSPLDFDNSGEGWGEWKRIDCCWSCLPMVVLSIAVSGRDPKEENSNASV